MRTVAAQRPEEIGKTYGHLWNNSGPVQVASVRDHAGVPRRAEFHRPAAGKRLDLDTVHHRPGAGDPCRPDPCLRQANQGTARYAAASARSEEDAGEVQGEDGPALPPGDGAGTDGAVQEARHQPVL